MLTFGDSFLGQQRVLVVAPHPDDETLGCAGSIARIKKLGGEAYVMIASAGGIAQHAPGEAAVETAAEMRFVPGTERMSELARVLEFLKVDGWDVLYQDDASHMRLDTLPQLELVNRIENESPLALNVLRPTMLMLPALSFNQDHAAVFRACMAATRPSAPGLRHQVPFVLAYDNTTAFWSLPHETFHPNVYIDISDFLEQKVRALQLHASQLRPEPFHASPQGLRTTQRFFGGQVAVEAAEAFNALRMVF